MLKPSKVPIGRRRRRGYRASEVDPRASVELRRDEDGFVHWVYTPPRLGAPTHRRTWRSSIAPTDQVVQRFAFDALGTNRITSALEDLDARLTPDHGMKQWVRAQGAAVGSLVKVDAPELTGRTLLFVHGTFSKTQMFFDEFAETAEGRELLAEWEGQYAHILAFDHHTLSVGAWSNAVDLIAQLRNVQGPIDVVCHSRGGLVVSWALRLRALPVERVVFVASPLVGTSLAAPDRLRAALDRLANYADTAAAAGVALSSVLPIANGAAGLAKIFGNVLRLGSSLPLADAAVALVPGLASQQRSANSLEIRQLFQAPWMKEPAMVAIGTDFRPPETDVPFYKFWKRFHNVGDQLKDAASDLVFPDKNDLVVDVDSMNRLGEQRVFDFESIVPRPGADLTHHTNYFRNPDVIGLLRTRLA